MDEVKFFLQKHHFDIFDLLDWNALQLEKCGKEHRVVHEKYRALLERFKEHHFHERHEGFYGQHPPVVKAASMKSERLKEGVIKILEFFKNPPP